jgi:cullin-associated NEDD8-dissociated protein 1
MSRYGTSVPSNLPAELIPQLKAFINTNDVSLLSQSLAVVTSLLQQAPKSAFPQVERDLLSDIAELAHSPRVSGAALDSLLAFVAALVCADDQIGNHLIPNLTISADKAPKADVSLANVARCVAQVAKAQQAVAAGIIAEFTKHVKVVTIISFAVSGRFSNYHIQSSKSKLSQLVLSLLVLGEIGRFM